MTNVTAPDYVTEGRVTVIALRALTTLSALHTMMSAAGQTASPLKAESGNPPSESADNTHRLKPISGHGGGFRNPVQRAFGLEPLPGKKELMVSSKESGFSLIEMAVVLAIALVMMAVAFISLQPALRDAHNNAGYDTVLVQLRAARERAIEGRQQYIVCFGNTTPAGAATPMGVPDAQSVQLYQWPAGAALSSAVQVSKLELPSDVQFQVISGIPTGAPPDGFGAGTVALDLDQGVAAGITNQVMFQPDGSSRDVNGNMNSGVLYLGRNSDLYSARAVTVFAASGRIRGWRLVNKAGTATWIEQ